LHLANVQPIDTPLKNGGFKAHDFKTAPQNVGATGVYDGSSAVFDETGTQPQGLPPDEQPDELPDFDTF
jgi:hypothetical protein